MPGTQNTTQFKRRFPRRKFFRAVGFLFNGRYFVSEGDAIGEGGIAMYLPEDMPMNAEGVATFKLPNGSFVCLRVEIRNIALMGDGRYLMGCLFKNLKFEHKREIRAYVSARTEFEQAA